MSQAEEKGSKASLEEWLKSHELSSLVSRFEEYSVKLKVEDLLEFNDEDMKELCDELCMQSGERVKFVQAVKSIEREARVERSATKEVVHIFLGPEERDVIDKLHNASQHVDMCLNHLQSRMKLLELSTKKCKIDISLSFNQCAKALQSHKKELLANLQTIQTQRVAPALQEIGKCDEIESALSKAQQDFKEISSDESLSAKQRIKKMGGLLQAVPPGVRRRRERGKEEADPPEEEELERVFRLVFDRQRLARTLEEHAFVTVSNSYRVLRFGRMFSPKDFVLEENGTKAIRTQASRAHSYVMVDDDPVRRGIHCWRVRTHNPMRGLAWIMWGVGEAGRDFKKYSCRDPSVWGIAPMNYFYGDADLSYDHAVSTNHFKQQDICVDMMLDIERRELRFAVVDFDESPEVVLRGISTAGKNGWVPHFNIRTGGLWIKVAKIPPQWYRKDVNRIPAFAL